MSVSNELRASFEQYRANVLAMARNPQTPPTPLERATVFALSRRISPYYYWKASAVPDPFYDCYRIPKDHVEAAAKTLVEGQVYLIQRLAQLVSGLRIDTNSRHNDLVDLLRYIYLFSQGAASSPYLQDDLRAEGKALQERLNALKPTWGDSRLSEFWLEFDPEKDSQL